MKTLLFTFAFLFVTSSSLCAFFSRYENSINTTNVNTDTLKALHKLANRQKRKENVIRLLSIITTAGWITSGATDDNSTQSLVHYAFAGLTIISSISIEKNFRIRRSFISKILADYENGTPLPVEVKKILKKKDFK